ncbi:MAG: hypothetical protein H7301_08605 [Cryobacterium sp.]|nr:hypothetical protein [Oligoflexia bacterium]
MSISVSGFQIRKVSVLALVLASTLSLTAIRSSSADPTLPVPGTLMTPSQREADLKWAFTIFDENYAPMDYKQQIHHFDYEVLKKKTLRRAKLAETNEEFYVILQEFVAVFQDAHTSLTLSHSDLPGRSKIAFAGFLVDRIGNKFVVREIVPIADPQLLPIKVGDEILEVDGVPVGEYIRKMVVPYRNLGNMDSNVSLLVNMAFMRDSLKIPLPQKPNLSLKIAPAKPDGAYAPAIKTVNIPWDIRDYSDFKREMTAATAEDGKLKKGGRQVFKVTDKITGKDFLMAYLDPAGRIISADKLSIPKSSDQTPNYEKFEFLDDNNVTFDAKIIKEKAQLSPLERLKSERIIPEFANYVDTAQFFPAFVYYSVAKEKNGRTRKVPRGYIRIESFSPDPIRVPGTNGKRATMLKPTMDGLSAELRRTLAVFQDAGVEEVYVDTIDNPGGSLEEMLMVSQSFSNKRIDLLTMSLKLNENWLNDIERAARNTPYPAREMNERAYESMKKSLSEGKTMSEPMSMDMIAPFQILPNTDLKRPFKNLFIMVNEGNASCGDIFPAIMQDNKLAKVIGWNTMGAGGNVTNYYVSPNAHAVLRQTESLVIRKDGTFLENNGVKPDFPIDFALAKKLSIVIAMSVREKQPGSTLQTQTRFDMKDLKGSFCEKLLK